MYSRSDACGVSTCCGAAHTARPNEVRPPNADALRACPTACHTPRCFRQADDRSSSILLVATATFSATHSLRTPADMPTMRQERRRDAKQAGASMGAGDGQGPPARQQREERALRHTTRAAGALRRASAGRLHSRDRRLEGEVLRLPYVDRIVAVQRCGARWSRRQQVRRHVATPVR